MDTEADKSWGVHAVACALIASVALVAYGNSFQSPFVYDDLGNIVHNEALRVFDFTVWQNFRSFRALPQMTLVLNYRLGGLNVVGYHLVNWVIHVLNALLIYWLCTALGRRIYRKAHAFSFGGLRWRAHQIFSIFAALFFVSHPIATEAVTYIIQRTVSLAALFYLLSLAAYVQFRLRTDAIHLTSPLTRPSHKATTGTAMWAFALLWAAVSLIAALAAMHSKQTAITLPLAVALLEVCFFVQRRTWRRSLALLIPWLLLLLYVPWRMYGAAWLVTDELILEPALDASSSIPPAAASAAGHIPLSRLVYLMTQFGVLLTYLQLILFPVGQSIDHDFTVYNSPFAWPVLFGSLTILSLLALAFWLLRRRPLAAFGIIFFFLALAPESSLVPLLEPVAEYRLYLSLVGATIIASYVFVLLHTNVVRGSWLLCTALLVISALTASTYLRNGTWREPAELWKNAIRGAPTKARPHNNLGTVLLERGEYDAARWQFETAIKLSPGYAHAHHNLGTALAKAGDLIAAALQYEQAMNLDPTITTTQVNLATVYLTLGRWDEAATLLEETIVRDQRSASARNLLGAVYLQQGLREAAMKQFEAALTIDPGYESARRNLEILSSDTR